MKLIREGAEKTVTVKLEALPAELTRSGNAQNPSAAAPDTDALDGVKVVDLNQDLRQKNQIPADTKGASLRMFRKNQTLRSPDCSRTMSSWKSIIMR